MQLASRFPNIYPPLYQISHLRCSSNIRNIPQNNHDSQCIRRKTYSELHGLGTSGPQLSGNDNLATLGTGLHDETENTVACSADGQTVQKLVTERLALSDGGQTAVLDLSGIEGDGVLGELEALLDQGGKLADAATLLTENLLGVRSTDDWERKEHPLVSMRPISTTFFMFPPALT